MRRRLHYIEKIWYFATFLICFHRSSRFNLYPKQNVLRALRTPQGFRNYATYRRHIFDRKSGNKFRNAFSSFFRFRHVFGRAKPFSQFKGYHLIVFSPVNFLKSAKNRAFSAQCDFYRKCFFVVSSWGKSGFRVLSVSLPMHCKTDESSTIVSICKF